ncbi:hypothetical protein M0802_006288 [Mischocyttarus mexicanus]|nr:hypothetical protein M0802_006288 [Mischocyttarus mexicanus]
MIAEKWKKGRCMTPLLLLAKKPKGNNLQEGRKEERKEGEEGPEAKYDGRYGGGRGSLLERFITLRFSQAGVLRFDLTSHSSLCQFDNNYRPPPPSPSPSLLPRYSKGKKQEEKNKTSGSYEAKDSIHETMDYDDYDYDDYEDDDNDDDDDDEDDEDSGLVRKVSFHIFVKR